MGWPIGGGCEIAISTDFIVAADDALFGQPEAMVVSAPGVARRIFLPRLLPRGKALQMLMTGERIPAPRRIGLGWSTNSSRVLS